jgi:hypothetical protein
MGFEAFRGIPDVDVAVAFDRDAALRSGGWQWTEQSAPPIAASEKGAPATCVSVVLLQFIEWVEQKRT